MRCIVLPEGQAPWLEPLIESQPGPWLRLSPPELLRRTWMKAAGTSAPRRIQARILWRQAVGAWVASRLPKGCTHVYAPSFAARRVFSAAQQIGAQTHLLEDLPDLRRLGVELDQASAAHPTAVLLRRHRARGADLATQQAERELAEEVFVPSADRMLAEKRCTPMPCRRTGPTAKNRLPTAKLRGQSSAGPRVLLSGLPVARSGSYEALEVLEALPEITLLLRPSQVVEPDALLKHPQVRLATPAELALEGVDAVIAPAWVQSSHPVLADALALGLPVVATRRAAGWLGLDPDRLLAQPDGKALLQALAASL